MNLIWVINGKKVKQTFLVILCGFLAAAIASVNSRENLAFTTTKSEPHAVAQVETNKRQIALTFDVGWGDTLVVPILKVLKEEGVHATFFLSGSWAEHHPDLAKKIVKGGHEIASHGYGHKNYRSMDARSIQNDMMLAREAIEKATGKTVTLFRPPNQKYNEQMLRTAQAMHYTVIASSVDAGDVSASSEKEILENVTENVSPGAIIRMHASDSAKLTAEALPALIDALKDEGYAFETVSDLLQNAHTESRLVK
ncbi:MAG TPA: polysaccharide deacetylase family protein [Bacillales bacterium]|nr:polysaccharide deacetylase family protein [Bacillales bacterium]